MSEILSRRSIRQKLAKKLKSLKSVANLLPYLCVLGPAMAVASGLDVQLKDLRNSFYFVFVSNTGNSVPAEAKAPASKECAKLTSKEVRKYGRLIHCEPEDDHVMCRLKSGEKLFAYESKETCDASLKKGIDPTPN